MGWARGEVIPIRHVQDGKVWFAQAGIVVEDRPEQLVYFVALGSAMQWSEVRWDTGVIDGPHPRRWVRTEALRILRPGDRHQTTLFWKGGTGCGAGDGFICWYVDLQEPWRRAGGGVVTFDRSLDIVIWPDRRWQWKDEDHFAHIQRFGWITPHEAAQYRAEGERVIERAQAGQSPFDDGWLGFTPDPAWTRPELPADWDEVP